MGTTVKSFCGVSLVGLSLVAYFFLAWNPLCVSHNEHLTLCQPDGLCPVYVVDYIDARCARALTLRKIAHPKDYPMWEHRLDADNLISAFVVSFHENRDSPFLMVVTKDVSNGTDLGVDHVN